MDLLLADLRLRGIVVGASFHKSLSLVRAVLVHAPWAALLALVAGLAMPPSAVAQSVVFTDSTWRVYDAKGQVLADPAQAVCLDHDVATGRKSPLNCAIADIPPPLPYGYTLGGWGADLSALPSSVRWIWASRVTPDPMSPAITEAITGETSPAGGQTYFFEPENDILLCEPPPGDPPLQGTLVVAADNEAEVTINGQQPPNNKTTDNASLHTINIPSSMLGGSDPWTIPPTFRPNRLTVKVTNGVSPADCSKDQYKCNPAGVVVAAIFQPPDRPCDGSPTGTKRKVGECPSGQTGGKYETCVCGRWGSPTNECKANPVCKGTGNRD